MIIPDINLLVYAHNSAATSHEQARVWWEQTLNDTMPVGLPWIVLSGYIRLMTHPRVLEKPISVDSARADVDAWLDQSCVLIVEPGEQFRHIFLDTLSQLGTAGNLTTDTYLAALAIEHQAVLQSFDSDFSRFPGLKWKNPIRL